MSNASAQNALQIDGLIAWLADGVVKAPTFEVHATPEFFQTVGETIITEDGVQAGNKGGFAALLFSSDGTEDNLVAHVITANKRGGFMIQARRDTTNNVMQIKIATKVPGATQTTPMAYDTDEQVDAALAALTADPGYVIIGYGRIVNNAGDWVANTNNMTTDITSITFTSVAEKVLPTPL